MATKKEKPKFSVYIDGEHESDHSSIEEAIDDAEDYAKACEVGESPIKVEILQRIRLGFIKNLLDWE